MRPSHTQYSAVFSSLLSMGFGEPLVALAIEAEGEDIQRCLAFLLSLQQPPSRSLSITSPLPSVPFDGKVESMAGSVTESGCTGTLPAMAENPVLRSWCEADDVMMDATKKFFGSYGVREVLEAKEGRRLWNGTFRRNFASGQLHRLRFPITFPVDSYSLAFSAAQCVLANRLRRSLPVP